MFEDSGERFSAFWLSTDSNSPGAIIQLFADGQWGWTVTGDNKPRRGKCATKKEAQIACLENIIVMLDSWREVTSSALEKLKE